MANKARVLATRVSEIIASDFDEWLEEVNARRAAKKLEALDKSKALRAIVTRAVKAGPVLFEEQA